MAGVFVAIGAADDPRLAAFRLNERGLASRADRRADAGAGLFLAEGDLVVERALSAGCRPHLALADGDRVPAVAHDLITAGIDVFIGGDSVRRMVTGLGTPHAIVALFHRPARPPADQLVARCDRLVAVEAVDNPGNIGSIVRNAAALGWGGLLLDRTSADPLSRRSLRVAMGTVFSLPHARTGDLVADLDRFDGEVYALTPAPDAVDIRAVRPVGRRALVIGSERAGLTPAVLANATPIRIAMAPGVDSLNAAAAAAIACYALG